MVQSHLNALIASVGSKLQERWKVFDFEVKKNWTPREKLDVKDRGAQGLHIACEYPELFFFWGGGGALLAVLMCDQTYYTSVTIHCTIVCRMHTIHTRMDLIAN